MGRRALAALELKLRVGESLKSFGRESLGRRFAGTTRTLRAAGAAIGDRALSVLAPAEGEEWLVALVALLLVLGAVRHRAEPWLRSLAPDPPPPVFEAATRVEPAR